MLSWASTEVGRGSLWIFIHVTDKVEIGLMVLFSACFFPLSLSPSHWKFFCWSPCMLYLILWANLQYLNRVEKTVTKITIIVSFTASSILVIAVFKCSWFWQILCFALAYKSCIYYICLDVMWYSFQLKKRGSKAKSPVLGSHISLMVVTKKILIWIVKCQKFKC